MVKISVYLTRHQLDMLRIFASVSAERETVSSLLRRGIDHEIERQRLSLNTKADQ